LSSDWPARDAAAASKLPSIRRPQSGRTKACFYLRETRAGTWVVRDREDRRGGIFFTREAALKYIRSEFGTDAQFVTTYLVQKEAA